MHGTCPNRLPALSTEDEEPKHERALVSSGPIGPRPGNILLSLLRLVPAAGIFSCFARAPC
eukprot:1192368-Prorocentrum_minimum.AAC.1